MGILIYPNYILLLYDMKKNGEKYLLHISYLDQAGLENKVHDIYEEMDFQIGSRHYFKGRYYYPFTSFKY